MKTAFHKTPSPRGPELGVTPSPVIAKEARDTGDALEEVLDKVELLRTALEKGELELVHQRLALLVSEAAALSSALAELIDLQRLEAGRTTIALQSFDLVALLHDVSHRARVLVGNKPVKVMDVSCPAPIIVHSDPDLVRRIMEGLTGHAAQCTERGRIALIVNRDNDQLRLTVTDTGRGMTASQIRDLSPASGKRRDDESRPEICLRIVKSLVERLGGAITVSSKVNEGTIIDVVLPIKPTDTARTTARMIQPEQPVLPRRSLSAS